MPKLEVGLGLTLCHFNYFHYTNIKLLTFHCDCYIVSLQPRPVVGARPADAEARGWSGADAVRAPARLRARQQHRRQHRREPRGKQEGMHSRVPEITYLVHDVL